MKLISTIVVLSSLVLSGCAASGKLYNDLSRESALQDPGKVRLVVFRTKDSMAGAGRDTLFKVDQLDSRFCSWGGFARIDTALGKHTLSISLPQDRNKCEIRIEAKAGEILFFEVTPNVGTIVSTAISGGIAAGFRTIDPTYAVDPNVVDVRNCNGYYQIVPVEKEYALKRLSELHESTQ